MNKRLLLFSSRSASALQAVSFVFPKAINKLNVVCITTAANVYAEENKAWLHEEMDMFRSFGLPLTEFDLEGKSPADVEAKLSDADVVYVTGGNTYFLLEHMQKTNFKTVITKKIQEGLLYIGTSAGAIVTCPNIDYIDTMDDPSLAHLEDGTGLELIDFYVMPHIDHEKYGPQAKAIVQNMRDTDRYTIGLKDSQVAFINNNFVEVFG